LEIQSDWEKQSKDKIVFMVCCNQAFPIIRGKIISHIAYSIQ